MPFALEHAVERADGEVPVFVGAGVVGAVVRIPGGKLDLEFVEAEGLEHCFGKVDAGDDFALRSALGMQKMCASSCVKPRTRSRPCMVPERS